MKKIAKIEYSYTPGADYALLYLESSIIDDLHRELNFTRKIYRLEDTPNTLFQDFEAYVVRGHLEASHSFPDPRNSRNTLKLHIQKAANKYIGIEGGINVSQLRGVELGTGFIYRCHPLDHNRAQETMRKYVDCVGFYYHSLEKYAKRIRHYKNIVKKS